MQKEEFLNLLKDNVRQRIVSRDEIILAADQALIPDGPGASLAGSSSQTPKGDPLKKHVSFSEALYYVGGFIVFLGIVILAVQNWSNFSTLTRILITFGSGVAAYLVGFFLSREEYLEKVGVAFYLISALVLPLGIMVIFDSVGADANDSGTQALTSFILLISYLISYSIQKKNIFLLFSILFGTWFYFSLVSFLFEHTSDWERKLEYLTMIAGISYGCLGYYFSKSEDKKSLCGFLYGFGSLFFLGSTLFLGGWSPSQHLFWEVIYPAIIFGVIYLGTYLKARSFLGLSVFFLMVYIIKITTEYFTEGLGWPLSLVIMGLAVIALGYLAYYLNKRYITEAEKMTEAV